MSDDIKKNRFFELRFNGNNISSAAGTLGVSYATAKRWNKDLESVVKSENIKKAIESSILSALSRFDNYSKLLSFEFAKLRTDAQKYDSISLYYEDRMNFLLKIIHMDRRLNNSMMNLLKMNKDLNAPPPDVKSSIDNLQCSMDYDFLNSEILSENAEISSKTPGDENKAVSNTEEKKDDSPVKDNIVENTNDSSDQENNEENNDNTKDDDAGGENTEDTQDDEYDEENDEDTQDDEYDEENDEDTQDDENCEDNDEDTSVEDKINEIIKRDYSEGISIAEYEKLLKRVSPLKEAEEIMKNPPKPKNKYGGSFYKPKLEDIKTAQNLRNTKNP